MTAVVHTYCTKGTGYSCTIRMGSIANSLNITRKFIQHIRIYVVL